LSVRDDRGFWSEKARGGGNSAAESIPKNAEEETAIKNPQEEATSSLKEKASSWG